MRSTRTTIGVRARAGLLRAALGTLALLGSACSGDGSSAPPAPTPGTLTLVVRSPNGPEGAAVLDVRADGISLVGSDSAVVYTEPSGDRLRILLLRAQPGGLAARLFVADTAAPLDARLVQVAGPDNRLRPLGGYAAEVVR